MGGTVGAVINILASASSLVIYLSPAPSLYRVVRERKAGEVSVLPLVSMLSSCFIWGAYGFLVHNLFPLFTTMAIGCAVALCYVCVFCKFTTQPRRAAKILGAALAFLSLLVLYVALGLTGATGQSSDQVATVVGYVGSVVSFLLYSSPFEKVAQVLRSRSAAGIPIGLCAASAVGNLLWAVSGALDLDLFVLLPNVVCAVPPLIQTALYLVFRPAKQTAVVTSLYHAPGSPVSRQLAPKTPPALLDLEAGAAPFEELATPAHSDTVVVID